MHDAVLGRRPAKQGPGTRKRKGPTAPWRGGDGLGQGDQICGAHAASFPDANSSSPSAVKRPLVSTSIWYCRPRGISSGQ